MASQEPDNRSNERKTDDVPKLYAIGRDAQGGFRLSRREFLGAGVTGSAVAGCSNEVPTAKVRATTGSPISTEIAPVPNLDAELAAEKNNAPSWGRVEMPIDEITVGKLRAHRGEIITLDVTKDGRLITAARDDDIKSWDFEKPELVSARKSTLSELDTELGEVTGERVETLTGHSTTGRSVANSVAFSPDGKLIVAGGSDNAIHLWSIKGKHWKEIKGHFDEVNSIAFSPDGRIIASGSDDRTITLRSVATGECLRTMTEPSGEGYSYVVNSVAFSPDGTMIVSGSTGNTVKVWDAATGECLKTMRGHEDSVNSVAFSPDGTMIVSGSFDKTVKLWSLTGKSWLSSVVSGEYLKSMNEHAASVNSVAFSPDGKMIVSGSSDNSVKLWDVATGECLQTLEGHEGQVNSVSFSPIDNLIVSSDTDGTVRLWEVTKGECLKVLQEYSGFVGSVAFSPTGKTIAAIEGDGTIKLRGFFPLQACLLRSVGPALVVLENGTVVLYDDKSLEFTEPVRSLGNNNAMPLACSTDGHSLVLVKKETAREAVLIDLPSGKQIRTFGEHTAKILSADFAPDGQQIVTGAGDKTAKVWDVSTGRCIWTIKESSSVLSTRYSPNGAKLAVGTAKSVTIYDAHTKQLLHTLGKDDLWNATATETRPLACWPNADRMAVGCGNGVRLFDLNTYTPLRTLSGHDAPITVLKVWSDGKYLVSGDGQGVVIIWDILTFEKAWVLFDQNAMDERSSVESRTERILRDEHWICTCNTILVPAGGSLPPNAVCNCNAIAVGIPIPGGGSVKRTKEMKADTCVCDTVCNCYTICTCNTVNGPYSESTTQHSDGVCTCNTICNCNTVGGGGSGGSGGTYYYYPT